MSLAQVASTVPAIQRHRGYVQVVKAGEYGFYAQHVTAEGAIPITQPIHLDGIPHAHPLEEAAEQEAVLYAIAHDLPCFFLDDPDGKWADLAIQQYTEQQERSDAIHRSRGGSA
jgi:hypothetical protein